MKMSAIKKTTLSRPISGSRGSHHIIISLLMLVFSLVGVWNLYNWYKAGTVKQNLTQMLTDFQQTADTAVTNPRDKDAVDKKIGEIREIIGKYTNGDD
jgi:hypothetical protein